ncbi:MAG: hypothetical protein D3910_12580 [Candidatus Electrothrix sp. ATG2]|nr:hypothetical protein [Candidatus Electrothrix sp. ATG2]
MEIDFPVDYKSEIVKEIRNDSLFSEHIRADLYPLANHKKDKRIGPFVKAVAGYLNCASNSPERALTFKEGDWDYLRRRYNMVQCIRPLVVDIVVSQRDRDEIEEGRKKEAMKSESYRTEAIKEFDELLRRIQLNYKEVIMSLDVVKRELLINEITSWKGK